MPKSKSNDTLLRQWEMLKMLPTRGWLTTADITKLLADNGYVVDQRTVQRNLQDLSGPFPLLCNDKSTPYGWRWKEGTDLGVPGLTVPEALTLKMVEEYLTPLLPSSYLDGLRPKLNEAHRVLSVIEESNTAARWTNKIRIVHPTLNVVPPKVDAEIMATLQEGLLHEKQLEVGYLRLGAEEPAAHLIHPLALVQRGPVTYLVCTVFDYDDIRLYAVHRMVSARMLDDDIKPPKDFNIDTYIKEGNLHFGNGGEITLKLQVSKDLAAHLRESPLSEDMTLEENGEGFEVTATIADTLQLRWWLFSRCSEAKVLGPKVLKDAVVKKLRDALESYE